MDNKEINKQIKKLEEDLAKLKEIANKPKDLFSIIENYSDVCKELGESEFTEADFDNVGNDYSQKLLDFAKIQQISKLFNGDWKPNWKDSNERKWFPYFEIKASGGFGFSFSGYHDYYTFSAVAFYKDQKTSDFIGKKFSDIYEKLI